MRFVVAMVTLSASQAPNSSVIPCVRVEVVLPEGSPSSPVTPWGRSACAPVLSPPSISAVTCYSSLFAYCRAVGSGAVSDVLIKSQSYQVFGSWGVSCPTPGIRLFIPPSPAAGNFHQFLRVRMFVALSPTIGFGSREGDRRKGPPDMAADPRPRACTSWTLLRL